MMVRTLISVSPFRHQLSCIDFHCFSSFPLGDPQIAVPFPFKLISYTLAGSRVRTLPAPFLSFFSSFLFFARSSPPIRVFVAPLIPPVWMLFPSLLPLMLFDLPSSGHPVSAASPFDFAILFRHGLQDVPHRPTLSLPFFFVLRYRNFGTCSQGLGVHRPSRASCPLSMTVSSGNLLKLARARSVFICPLAQLIVHCVHLHPSMCSDYPLSLLPETRSASRGPS